MVTGVLVALACCTGALEGVMSRNKFKTSRYTHPHELFSRHDPTLIRVSPAAASNSLEMTGGENYCQQRVTGEGDTLGIVVSRTA